MFETTYEQRLVPYVDALKASTKDELLVTIAGTVFGDDLTIPMNRPDTVDELKKILASFRPELHEPFDRDALTSALGESLVECWAEALDRPLTGRDLDLLSEGLKESGIRDVLKRFAAERASRDGERR